MTPQELLAKAETSLSSARLLLDTGDTDGACNRAYYAMFEAARFALAMAGDVESSMSARTHRGMISAFGMSLVNAGLVSPHLGRMINRAHQVRVNADYSRGPVEKGAAAELVNDAAEFLSVIKLRFPPNAD